MTWVQAILIFDSFWDHLRSSLGIIYGRGSFEGPFLGSFVVPYRPPKTITNRAAHTFLTRVQSPESTAVFRLCRCYRGGGGGGAAPRRGISRWHISVTFVAARLAGRAWCTKFQFSFTAKQLVLSQGVPVLAPPLLLRWFSNRKGTSFDDGKAREKD